MHSCRLQSAPAPLIRHRRGAIGEILLIDPGDLDLVSRGLQVAIKIKHVTGVRGVGRPGTPGNPNTHFTAQRRLPDDKIFARVIGRPPAVARAQVRHPLKISGVLGEAFPRALVIGDEVALLDRRNRLRVARVVFVGQLDTTEVGLRFEGTESLLNRGDFFAQCIGSLRSLLGLGCAQFPFAMLDTL